MVILKRIDADLIEFVKDNDSGIGQFDDRLFDPHFPFFLVIRLPDI